MLYLLSNAYEWRYKGQLENKDAVILTQKADIAHLELLASKGTGTGQVQDNQPSQSGVNYGTETNSSHRTDIVRGKIFRHETVHLDGHSFIGCTFDHVLLVLYNGGPFDLIGNKFDTTVVASESQPINDAIDLLKALEFFTPGTHFTERSTLKVQ